MHSLSAIRPNFGNGDTRSSAPDFVHRRPKIDRCDGGSRGVVLGMRRFEEDALVHKPERKRGVSRFLFDD